MTLLHEMSSRDDPVSSATKPVFETPEMTLRDPSSSVTKTGASQPLPFPVIVGCPRSGTSLLAVMLDAHPQFAVPPETTFLPRIMGLRAESASLRQQFFQIVTTDRVSVSNWSDFGLDADAFLHRLEAIRPFTLTAGVRAFYALYAECHAKRRVGEKTPGYLYTMDHIQALLPEAHFVHVIRDPRDTVLSWRKTWFAPTQDLAALSQLWRQHIEVARRLAVSLRRYMELRFEDLVNHPERELRRVCAFVGLDYDPSMLEFASRGEARLAQLQGRQLVDGRMVSREERTRIHANLARPPMRERIGVWRHEMPESEQRRVEAAAGPLLAELGYGASG